MELTWWRDLVGKRVLIRRVEGIVCLRMLNVLFGDD